MGRGVGGNFVGVDVVGEEGGDGDGGIRKGIRN